MATITTIKGKKGASYRAQIRKFEKGVIIYSEARTFPKKVLAERWGAKREQELLEPGALDRLKSSGITVDDLIARYILEFTAGAGRTKLKDLESLRQYDFARLPIDRLTSETLIQHAQERLKTIKPQTLLNDFVWLKAVYDSAYPAWKINVDSREIVAAKSFCAANGMIHRSEERERRPSADEIKALDEYFSSRDGRASIPMREIMWFAIESARRQTEITELLHSDNVPAHRTGIVRNIKHPRKKGLNKKFKYTEKAWAIVQRQPVTGDRIFPYNPRSIGAAFTRACHLLGIEDLHFHDLRREATSRLFEAGYSIQQVQMFTLHEDWKILSRYTNLRPEDLS